MACNYNDGITISSGMIAQKYQQTNKQVTEQSVQQQCTAGNHPQRVHLRGQLKGISIIIVAAITKGRRYSTISIQHAFPAAQFNNPSLIATEC